MKSEVVLIWLCVGIFVFSLIMLVSGIFRTGYVTEASTVSNVTISTYFSIAMSSNLTAGILFGAVNSTVATDLNATGNHGGSSLSQYNLTVSVDSNTNVSFNISANAALTSAGADIIDLGNQSYANATTNSASVPAVGSQVALTTDQVNAGNNIGIGNSNHYRFWLDIPAGQTVGSYNNTITFNGFAAT